MRTSRWHLVRYMLRPPLAGEVEVAHAAARAVALLVRKQLTPLHATPAGFEPTPFELHPLTRWFLFLYSDDAKMRQEAA